MTGQRIGYIRVSTFDQNPERQLEGVKVDRAFSDKASGKDVKRPQLEALISFARTGDTVVVHSMDRLARNLDDLRRIVQTLTQRGVHIEFVKEHLSFTGEDSPMANLMLSVMGAFAEFERALIRERQREGIALAKQRGAYRGRKKSLSSERIAELRQRVEAGEQKGTVAKLAMRQPFVLFKGLTFQKLCLPGAFRPGDHHNKMLRPGLCVVHASPQYL
ncbi:recombinase family protein [Acinetobacter baumannii]|uniref:recombinase family protein n=13 Tax=Acinetobacter baumannii TaxID=470 RepID=UPI00074307F2|nr:Tn3 family resolvase [Acinetobacter baumannii]ATU49669.1 resolvase [Acinetobacter baumannii]ATU57004.1 resolvase [Acinetobacter baumannii]AUG14003.1 recombinase family protein [Acinetobacter baumannii]MUS94368.1 recombinase family protein [Acinetobacter baumannii]